jgi:hypothetical protein
MQVKAIGPAANLADALAVFGCFAVVLGAVYWLGSSLTLLQEGQKQAGDSQKGVREELLRVCQQLQAGQKQAREELLRPATAQRHNVCVAHLQRCRLPQSY